jgi:hypothetical protein
MQPGKQPGEPLEEPATDPGHEDFRGARATSALKFLSTENLFQGGLSFRRGSFSFGARHVLGFLLHGVHEQLQFARRSRGIPGMQLQFLELRANGLRGYFDAVFSGLHGPEGWKRILQLPNLGRPLDRASAAIELRAILFKGQFLQRIGGWFLSRAKVCRKGAQQSRRAHKGEKGYSLRA